MADDLTRELGDANEALLAAALGFRATGSCPAIPAGAAPSDLERPSSAGRALEPPEPGVMEFNRDMRLPPGMDRR